MGVVVKLRLHTFTVTESYKHSQTELHHAILSDNQPQTDWSCTAALTVSSMWTAHQQRNCNDHSGLDDEAVIAGIGGWDCKGWQRLVDTRSWVTRGLTAFTWFTARLAASKEHHFIDEIRCCFSLVLVSLRGRLFGDDIEELGSQNTNVTVVNWLTNWAFNNPIEISIVWLCVHCASMTTSNRMTEMLIGY